MNIDRTPSVALETLVLGLGDWDFTGTSEGAGIGNRAPGTWMPPVTGSPPPWLALVCCPKCRNVSVLHRSVQTIDHLGKVSPDFICKYNVDGRECGFNRTIWLDKWNKQKQLYACAIERFLPGGKLAPEIHYMHAVTHEEAKFHLGPGNYRIVAVAPAVGAIATDAHGDKLAADQFQLKLKNVS
jgi:hypothetical protein